MAEYYTWLKVCLLCVIDLSLFSCLINHSLLFHLIQTLHVPALSLQISPTLIPSLNLHVFLLLSCSCWLSLEGGLLYAFVGPAAAVVLVFLLPFLVYVCIQCISLTCSYSSHHVPISCVYLLNDLLNLVVIIVVAIHFNHSNSLGTGAVNRW